MRVIIKSLLLNIPPRVQTNHKLTTHIGYVNHYYKKHMLIFDVLTTKSLSSYNLTDFMVRQFRFFLRFEQLLSGLI